MNVVRALVVDDSALCRELLRELLEADGDIVVVGEAGSGAEAMGQVEALRPDIVTLDVRMPGMGGLAVVAQLMSKRPLPIIVVTGIPVGPHDATVFEAIRRGALDVVRKPRGLASEGARQLRERVRALSRVPTVRHPGARVTELLRPPKVPGAMPRIRVIGIGASAGGPAALTKVLSSLPANLGVTVALVQHLPPGFSDSFARFLRARTSLKVAVAHQPIPLVPGQVVVAPDDKHLVSLSPTRLGPSDAAPAGLHRPSVDVLFHSLADTHGADALAVLLTGIGHDGAAGLKQLHDLGATTIAQDEATSAVFGMPKAAIECHAAAHVLALGNIAAMLAARAGTTHSTGSAKAPSRRLW